MKSKYKHRFMYIDPNRPEDGPQHIGDSYTHEDCRYRLPSTLTTLRAVNLLETPNYDDNESFLLTFKPRSDMNGKLKGYVTYLRGKDSRGGYMDLGNNSRGILVAMKENDKSLLGSSSGELDGFRLYVSRISKETSDTRESEGENTITNSGNGSGTGNDQAAAASHYDTLKRDIKDRHHSHVFHMRNFNNWCKTALIQNCNRYLPDGNVRVLDLGCGKGGDLQKWSKFTGGLQDLVGIDIAQNSLNQFSDRLLRLNKHKVSRLACCDMGCENLQNDDIKVLKVAPTEAQRGEKIWRKCKVLDEKETFDIISCQFAVHYMFQTLERAKFFFCQVRDLLSDDGVFIATTMDCRVIANMALHHAFGEKAKEKELKKKMGNKSSSDADEDEKEKLEVEGHSGVLVRLTFSDYEWRRLLDGSAKSTDMITDESITADIEYPSAFGIRYHFQLYDTPPSSDGKGSGQAAVDAPEWLVPLGVPLESLAKSCGLKVVSAENLQEFFHENMHNPEMKEMLDTMDVFNFEGTISAPEWSIAGMYTTLVLQKIDAPPPGSRPEIKKRKRPCSPDVSPPSDGRSMVAGAGTIVEHAPRSPSESPEYIPDCIDENKIDNDDDDGWGVEDEDAYSGPQFDPSANAMQDSTNEWEENDENEDSGRGNCGFEPATPPDSPGGSTDEWGDNNAGVEFEPATPPDSPGGSTDEWGDNNAGVEFEPATPPDSPDADEWGDSHGGGNFEPATPPDSPDNMSLNEKFNEKTESGGTFAPVTPPSPETEDSDEEDEEIMRLLQAKKMAVVEAGGESVWARLPEGRRNELLAQAKAKM
jgi:SAM-dependent methyltransferase